MKAPPSFLSKGACSISKLFHEVPIDEILDPKSRSAVEDELVSPKYSGIVPQIVDLQITSSGLKRTQACPFQCSHQIFKQDRILPHGVDPDFIQRLFEEKNGISSSKDFRKIRMLQERIHAQAAVGSR